jgi:hypothetical protein
MQDALDVEVLAAGALARKDVDVDDTLNAAEKARKVLRHAARAGRGERERKQARERYDAHEETGRARVSGETYTATPRRDDAPRVSPR